MFNLVSCFSEFLKYLLVYLRPRKAGGFSSEDWKKLSVWSSVLFIVSALVMCEREITFIMKRIYRFLYLLNIMTYRSHNAHKYLFKVKSRNSILICWLQWCHAVFLFDFEHIQQIHLIFSMLTLNMYLSAGQRIKSTEQIKWALNSKVFF